MMIESLADLPVSQSLQDVAEQLGARLGQVYVAWRQSRLEPLFRGPDGTPYFSPDGTALLVAMTVGRMELDAKWDAATGLVGDELPDDPRMAELESRFFEGLARCA